MDYSEFTEQQVPTELGHMQGNLSESEISAIDTNMADQIAAAEEAIMSASQGELGRKKKAKRTPASGKVRGHHHDLKSILATARVGNYMNSKLIKGISKKSPIALDMLTVYIDGILSKLFDRIEKVMLTDKTKYNQITPEVIKLAITGSKYIGLAPDESLIALFPSLVMSNVDAANYSSEISKAIKKRQIETDKEAKKLKKRK